MKPDRRRPEELGAQELSDPRADVIMEELRKKAATVFGITVSGPYMCLRFGDGKRLVQVGFQVTSITDSSQLEPIDPDADK